MARSPAASASSTSRRVHWPVLGTALTLLAAPLLFTWPLALNLAGWFPGDRPADAMIHTRQLWWVRQALGSWANPYESPLILFPQGARLYFETLVPLDGLLSVLPALIGGPIFAYNTVVLGMLGASGLAAWALATRVSGSRAAGVVAAVVYATSPYLMNHVRTGHIGVISAVWPPLVLLALLELLRTGRPQWIVLGAVFLAATAYTDLQAALALALVAGLLLCASLVQHLRAAGAQDEQLARVAAMRWARDVGLLAASGVLALALTAPLLLGIARELRDGEQMTPPLEHSLRNSADLLAFVSPQPLHPLWGAAMRSWYAAHQLDRQDESVVYPGLVVLALAAAGLAARRTRRPFWAVVALCMALLSLGPELHLGGPRSIVPMPLGLPTPYGLLQQAPLVSIGRTPARFMGMGMLALAILAAAGVAALRGGPRDTDARSSGRSSGTPPGQPTAIVAPLAALLVGFEFLSVPFPVSAPRVPGGYQVVAARGCSGPLLELPVDAGAVDQKARMFFQTLHGCAISGGYVSRGGDSTDLTEDWRKVARQGDPESRSARRLAEEIRSLGFRYAVVWKPTYESKREREQDLVMVRGLFPGEPLFENADSAVYDLTRRP